MRLIEFAPHRRALGLRGEGFQVAGEALFLKRCKPRSIAAERAPEESLKLAKLAFFAVVFGQVEYALSLLDQYQSIKPIEFPVEWKERAYVQFLCQLHALSKGWPLTFQPTFGERYSFAASKARFQPLDQKERVGDPTPIFLDSSSIRKVVLSVRGTLSRRLPRLRSASRAFRSVNPLPVEADSGIEALLKSYGLSEQAAILKSRRGRQGP
jgi:hypothetical protein